MVWQIDLGTVFDLTLTKWVWCFLNVYVKGCPVFSFTGNTLVFSHNLQILRSFLGRECFKHASQQAISSMKQHIQNACKLTWGLATAWPPLIVAQPGEFREELHDREFQYWDRSNQSLKLYYTRPVLFHSCEGRVGVKGWVGNRNTVSNSTHHCN